MGQQGDIAARDSVGHDGPWILDTMVVVVHGIARLFAFGVLLNIGAIIARFFKPPKRLCLPPPLSSLSVFVCTLFC